VVVSFVTFVATWPIRPTWPTRPTRP